MLNEQIFGILKSFEAMTSIMYIVLFLAIFFIEKRMSSTTVALLVLCLCKGIASLLLPDLLTVASQTGLHYKFAWYGCWMGLNVICIGLILKFHLANKIRASNVAITVSLAYVILTVVQAVDFIDRATLNSNAFAMIYQISIPTINIGLIPLICYFWLQDFRKTALMYKES
ncbi:MAG: hypothetical protein E6Q75_15295 [Rheinheimera sp.]|nr:MAG: hypothetical protein E6Q75_15295 [Rheinheimera sp.]